MAQHKKSHLFLRIKTSTKEVVCINPFQLASFRIVEGYSIMNKDKQEIGKGDTIFFYLPVGTITRFTVGMEFTQEEFNYVSSALVEFLYQTEPEFNARTEAINAKRLQEWNDKMAAPEIDAVEEPLK